jgi:hypothetical protein
MVKSSGDVFGMKNGIFIGIYPLVMTNIAIENGDL